MSKGKSNKGIIYILTNPSMPGIIKIGSTTNIEQRLKSLDNTSVPTPFILYYGIEVEDYINKEKLIQKGYEKDRIRHNREFFTLEPENVVAMFQAIGGTEINSSYIDISIDQDGKELSSNQYEEFLPKANITTFDMLKIKIGSDLVFTRNDNIVCKVCDNRKVEYKGEKYSLSQLTKKLLQQNYNWKNGHVNGFRFWKYEDEILTIRRERIEKEMYN